MVTAVGRSPNVATRLTRKLSQENAKKPPMAICDLPIELWQHIFRYLSTDDKIHMVLASKYFQGAVDMAKIEAAKARRICAECKFLDPDIGLRSVIKSGLGYPQKCVDCHDGNSVITRAHARYLFWLDVHEFKKLPRHRPHALGTLTSRTQFKFHVVRDAALKKYGKRMRDVLRDVLRDAEAEKRRKQAARQALEAKRAQRLVSGLEKLGVQYSKQCDHLARGYIANGRDYQGTLARMQGYVRNLDASGGPRAKSPG